ncbi:hypothetical protein F5880DRAFT_1510474 [Lentinula raphanica]|nr:hypothetical protein F5880DRAFT_1510474 [Lentinula raphanica]
MSDRPKQYERQKFEISLAEYLRKGLKPEDYARYKPKPINSATDLKSDHCNPAEVELTPQQKARKRYEERNKEVRLAKARERMAKRRATDPKGERLKQKVYEEEYRKM